MTKRTKKILSRRKVKRALLFHLSLTEELKMKYRKGNNKEKRTVAYILRGKLIKKYKLAFEESFSKPWGLQWNKCDDEKRHSHFEAKNTDPEFFQEERQ